MSKCDPCHVDQKCYNGPGTGRAFNKKLLVKWLNSLPSIAEVSAKYKEQQKLKYSLQNSCPSETVKSERSDKSIKSTRTNMSCPSRPGSGRVPSPSRPKSSTCRFTTKPVTCPNKPKPPVCSFIPEPPICPSKRKLTVCPFTPPTCPATQKPRACTFIPEPPVCPARSKPNVCPFKAKQNVCPAKTKMCPSMVEKLRNMCPAEAIKYLEYNCPSEIDKPKKYCCPKPKPVCPAKSEKEIYPVMTKKSSTTIRRRLVCPNEKKRTECPAMQPKICPAKQHKVCPSKKKVCPAQQEHVCPAKQKHVCPAKMNICPSMKQNVCPSMQQDVCPAESNENICPGQEQPPKVKKISKTKYSYEVYTFPKQEDEEFMCPGSESEPDINECCCPREDLECADSQTETELDEYYEEQCEEVSYIDSDEGASCADDGYDNFTCVSPSKHSVCYQEEPHRTCSCD